MTMHDFSVCINISTTGETSERSPYDVLDVTLRLKERVLSKDTVSSELPFLSYLQGFKRDEDPVK
jgi:hypothetical protein